MRAEDNYGELLGAKQDGYFNEFSIAGLDQMRGDFTIRKESMDLTLPMQDMTNPINEMPFNPFNGMQSFNQNLAMVGLPQFHFGIDGIHYSMDAGTGGSGSNTGLFEHFSLLPELQIRSFLPEEQKGHSMISKER